MKIIIDLSQMLHATYLGKYKDTMNNGFLIEDLENLTRSVVTKRIYDNMRKFNCSYTDVIIAIDSKSWRFDHFPDYKWKRRKGKSDSDIDYGMMKDFFNSYVKELDEYFPFTTIREWGAEADDIIGTLSTTLNSVGQKVCIISGDHDFIQLIRKNLIIYDPFHRKFVGENAKIGNNTFMDVYTKKDAEKFLMYHIILGDSGDGVPNVKSDDDAFSNPLKQQVRTGPKWAVKNIVTESDKHKLMDEYKENWKRNKLLVDLEETPHNIKVGIITKYNNSIKNVKPYDINKTFEYCDNFFLHELRDTIKNKPNFNLF